MQEIVQKHIDAGNVTDERGGGIMYEQERSNSCRR